MRESSAAPPPPTRLVGARSARSAAAWFNWGNIAAIAVPIPIGLLWVCGSMIIYALNRHHPNARVGYFTQQAAYRFYGITGFFVAVATFFPGNKPVYYLVAWASAALIIIPWSVIDLIRIRREPWVDCVADPEATTEH